MNIDFTLQVMKSVRRLQLNKVRVQTTLFVGLKMISKYFVLTLLIISAMNKRVKRAAEEGKSFYICQL